MLTPVAATPQCFGEMNGAAVVSISGGRHPFTYLWSNGSTDAQLSIFLPGVYTVTVTDAAGCTGQATVSVAEPLELIVQVLTTRHQRCHL